MPAGVRFRLGRPLGPGAVTLPLLNSTGDFPVELPGPTRLPRRPALPPWPRSCWASSQKLMERSWHAPGLADW